MAFINYASVMARRVKHMYSPRLSLVDHPVLFSCSSCPSLTHCPSHQMTGSMLTPTSYVFVFEATWSGPHPGLR